MVKLYFVPVSVQPGCSVRPMLGNGTEVCEPGEDKMGLVIN